MAKSVYSKEERKAQFIKTGLKLARKVGLSKVSASAVATEHKITAPLIFHIFGTRDKFHAAIKAEARKQGVNIDGPKVVAAPRKRSVAEVKAIKNKVAGVGTKQTTYKEVGKAIKKTVTKINRSAKTGKLVTAKFAKANPDTTVTEKIKRKSAVQAQKFPTMPAPSPDAIGENLVQKI